MLQCVVFKGSASSDSSGEGIRRNIKTCEGFVVPERFKNTALNYTLLALLASILF